MARPILYVRIRPIATTSPRAPIAVLRCSRSPPFRPRFYASFTPSSTPPKVSSPRAIKPDARALKEEPKEPLILLRDIPAPGTGFIRVLELNRPGARNAISRDLLASFRQHIDDVHAQYGPEGEERLQDKGAGIGRGPTRALVIASRVDETFCAGADLKERKLFTPDETQEFLTNLRSTLASLADLPIPTISSISSVALGGGLELSLATNFRVLASTAVVGLPETRLAIIPGAGGTYRLPALIGVRRARDLILTGRRVGAAEAYFLGIADRLVDVPEKAPIQQEQIDEGVDVSGGSGSADGQGGVTREWEGAVPAAPLMTRAREMALDESIRLATEICEGGPVAVRAALKALRWTREEMENKMYEVVVSTDDRHEALHAFAKKRKPEFKGR